MSVSLFEQFMAVGSVKSLVTGKEYSRNTNPPENDLPPTTEENTSVQTHSPTDR